MVYDKFDRVPFPDNAIMRAAKQDENISAFLSFSPVYRWDIFDYDHYEVRFIDLRYRRTIIHSLQSFNSIII